ncbi:uncharacterized protein NESG_01566 [Nematocida ausubeli]|uniref:Uncharacterized protein n=1 Tax=Nematocida ausubeli (strain ATCC PRA-371 / ERTm2) TaxID=1913371 RepID=A0A086J0C0_NEMA1|nr:uncharacterized protein NESG_01566 [Nematocida ausubeli]KFG25588.1 hypothetical protein NESG_01566 [Nematocida ausubeli]
MFLYKKIEEGMVNRRKRALKSHLFLFAAVMCISRLGMYLAASAPLEETIERQSIENISRTCESSTFKDDQESEDVKKNIHASPCVDGVIYKTEVFMNIDPSPPQSTGTNDKNIKEKCFKAENAKIENLIAAIEASLSEHAEKCSGLKKKINIHETAQEENSNENTANAVESESAQASSGISSEQALSKLQKAADRLYTDKENLLPIVAAEYEKIKLTKKKIFRELKSLYTEYCAYMEQKKEIQKNINDHFKESKYMNKMKECEYKDYEAHLNNLTIVDLSIKELKADIKEIKLAIEIGIQKCTRYKMNNENKEFRCLSHKKFIEYIDTCYTPTMNARNYQCYKTWEFNRQVWMREKIQYLLRKAELKHVVKTEKSEEAVSIAEAAKEMQNQNKKEAKKITDVSEAILQLYILNEQITLNDKLLSHLILNTRRSAAEETMSTEEEQNCAKDRHSPFFFDVEEQETSV